MKRKRILGILFIFVFAMSLSFGFALTVQAGYDVGGCCTGPRGIHGMTWWAPGYQVQCICSGFFVDGVWNPNNCELVCPEMP